MGAVIILVVGGLLSAMLILPRQRQMRRHGALVASLHVGDAVMTGSGIYGTITDLEDDLAWLELAPGVVIKVARRAIASKVEPDTPTTAAPAAGSASQPAPSDSPDGAPVTLDLDQHDPVEHDADGRAG
jgi:preprotein translocase subunit YajC